MTRPTTIAEVAKQRITNSDHPLWKPVCEFLDVFYEADGKDAGMLAEEPSPGIDRCEGAYLAAIAEYLSDLHGMFRRAG